MGTDNFKNKPSERFYRFFKEKIEKDELTHAALAAAFGRYEKNPSSLLNGLKNGLISVTLEMLLIAQEKFDLNPCDLFEKAGRWEKGKLVSPEEFYEPYKSLRGAKRIGDIVQEIFKMHKVNVKEYSQRLEMTEQNLYKQLRGEGRMYADTLIQICKDFSEPLEQFRLGILPQGHTLEKIKFCEETIKTKNQMIKMLEKEVERLGKV